MTFMGPADLIGALVEHLRHEAFGHSVTERNAEETCANLIAGYDRTCRHD